MRKTSHLVYEDLRTGRLVAGKIESGSNTYYTKMEALIALMVGENLEDETVLSIARDLVIHYHQVIHDSEHYALSTKEEDGRFVPYLSGRISPDAYVDLVNSKHPVQKKRPERKKH